MQVFGDAPVMLSDSAGSSVRQRSCKGRNGHAVAAPNPELTGVLKRPVSVFAG